MKAHLMFEQVDFDACQPDPDLTDDLTEDLCLEVLWQAAACDDDTVYRSVRCAMLHPLTDPAEIAYRLDVTADCLAHPQVMRELYEIASRTCADGRNAFPALWGRLSSDSILHRAVDAMTVLLSGLRRMRDLLRDHRSELTCTALRQLRQNFEGDVDDAFLEQMDDYLRSLRFRDGVLASARLGRLGQGVDHVLHTPLDRNRNRLIPRHPPVARPHRSHTVARDDISGLQDLERLRTYLLHLAARAMAESVDHLLTFTDSIRCELAFYAGVITLSEQLRSHEVPTCRPTPAAGGTAHLMTQGLYDPCLALGTSGPIQGNGLRSEGTRLVLITGANSGGKSTFLRALGIAHLMMQCGMPTPASKFEASPATAVLTHFKREEDEDLGGGKLDEELRRMQAVVARLCPGALLLCNESFSTTNEREGAQIAGEALRALNHAGVTVVFVTHLYELAHAFWQTQHDGAVFLRAERSPDGSRPYLLREAEPLPTSYGADL